MEGNAIAPRKLAALFSHHALLLETDISGVVESFKATNPNLEGYSNEVTKYRKQAEEIWSLCTDDVIAGCLSDCRKKATWLFCLVLLIVHLAHGKI